MPRGRHRHSPPLHRLLPPSAIAGVSLTCAFGPWVFSDPAVLRVVAAVAAATAVVGAAVLRRWDMHAGKQVADLTRARASDEWRFEERVAELETDLDESRDLRGKLEKRLRAKRAELAGLRNEHAALLRRYATAETERASALEGRRLLEIENTAEPETHALPPARVSEERETETAVSETPETAETVETADDEPKVPAAFSPEGSQLYARARSALAKLDPDAAPAEAAEDSGAEEPVQVPSGKTGGAQSAQEDEAEGQSEAADEHARAAAAHPAEETDEIGEGRATDEAATEPTGTATDETPTDGTAAARAAAERTAAAQAPAARAAAERTAAAPAGSERAAAPAAADRAVSAAAVAVVGSGRGGSTAAVSATAAPATAGAVATVPEGTAPIAPTVPAAPEPVRAMSAALVPRPAAPVVRPSGHFTVPTAVAVVPAAQPVRRPAVEGGFDFFGTKSATPNALESVQNEDLADVVGQEALALHKAEAEAEFKPAGEEARGVGQVIDLTAHDETEVIDLQGLRSAVS